MVLFPWQVKICLISLHGSLDRKIIIRKPNWMLSLTTVTVQLLSFHLCFNHPWFHIWLIIHPLIINYTDWITDFQGTGPKLSRVFFLALLLFFLFLKDFNHQHTGNLLNPLLKTPGLTREVLAGYLPRNTLLRADKHTETLSCSSV